MRAGRLFLAASSLAIGTGLAAPATAQTAAATDPQDGAAAAAPDAQQSFEPAYFAQFAPRNALDMVTRIPGFAITGGNNQGQRGLGQATQNVIVNGERFSSKSESIEAQLTRIPAEDVVRIELVDGNTLDIPGLTGLVANVVYQTNGASGQFRWTTGFRPHNTEPQLYGGEISLTGRSGALSYTVALTNANDRFGADGPILVTDGDGELIETQTTRFAGAFDNPRLATSFGYDFGGDVKANLNLTYGEDFFFRDEPETGAPVSGPVRTRFSRTRDNGPEYEIGGDFSFPLGPGNVKLIGLERFERDNFSATVIDSFSDGSASTGFRFEQSNGIGERIGRIEYGWKMWDADWQLSGEAAFNRLNRASSLFSLNQAGVFDQVPFPQGTGGVTEDRYDASLSYSRSLSSTLSMQAIAAVEFSKIEQTGAAANSRRFRRPKGSLAATWKPSPRLDVSLTLARRVSQLGFGDFLASVSLNDDNQNWGNNELVPYQSWNVELQANRNFGDWGSLRLDARQAWFEDFIDWFPLANGGEARGNIGKAERLHLELTATLKMDPIGWKGARLDVNAIKRFMSVTDPFTGEDRPFSYDQLGGFTIDFRHDIASSDWAYGASFNHFDNAPYARRFEIGRNWEGPVFDTLFVENKDVLGLTVRAQVGNLLGARNYFRRTVFDGERLDNNVEFNEYADRRIGPIFRMTVSGDF